ncbi:MAG: hypothetical protein V4692_15680 [Bdellovibrionota bacterium]
MRIWIVEDESDLCDYYFEIVKSLTRSVVMCSTVKMVTPRQNDIVILDLGGTGSEDLVSNGAHVLRVTGDPEKEADLYKPFTPEALRECIQTYIDASEEEED